MGCNVAGQKCRTKIPQTPDLIQPDKIPGIVRSGGHPPLKGVSGPGCPLKNHRKAADFLGFLRLFAAGITAGQKCRTELFLSGLEFCPAPHQEVV